MLAKCPENNRFSSFPAHCCKYYLLEYHRDRMLAAAHDFGWDLVAQKFAGPDGLRCLEILLDDHVRGKWSGESIPTIDTPLKLRILLSKAVNQEGEITEGSITTPYFFRNGHWITPRASCGGNIGTTRRWAIQQGLCIEGVVNIEEVKVGETVWLSNGVRGFGWGVVETGGFEACNES